MDKRPKAAMSTALVTGASKNPKPLLCAKATSSCTNSTALVDVSMMEGQMSLLNTLIGNYLADGKLPGLVGLWWLTLPLLAGALWFYLRDGRLSRPRRHA